VVVAAGNELVGREAELAALRQFVDALAEGPRGAIIRGEAGIGKTVLWRAAVEAGEQGGADVLATRCAEAEMPLALGGVGDLIETALAEVADQLAEPQRRLLAVVVGLEAPPDEAPDHLAVPRAFLAYLRALSARSPVLLAIDDAHWLDPASQRILAFVARRVGDAPVGILATVRGNVADPFDLRQAFDQRFTEIRVGALSIGALHHLIRTRLGLRIPRPTVARVHEASGGNPMFALEFARVAAAAVGPLPMPSSLEQLVRERVTGLPGEIVALLATVAAVERPTATLLEAVVDDARAVLDAASTAGVVTASPAGVVRVAHPLLAAAAYGVLAPAARRELHARLAAASKDPEEQARHVALSTFDPDGAAAALLDEAAARTRSHGAPDAAAALAEQAIRLTPPADVVGHEERTLALATYLTDAGQMADADAVLIELLAGPISGSRRARALGLAILVESDVEKAERLAAEALEHARDDPRLRAVMLLWFGSFPLLRGELAEAEAINREALAIAENLDDPVLLSSALMCVANIRLFLGRPEPSLLERAVAIAGDRPPIKGFATPRLTLAQHRLWGGDLAGARELLAVEVVAIRSWGYEDITQRVVLCLVDLEWRAGNWELAERHLDELSMLVFDGDNRWGEALVLPQQALLAASRGRVDEARRLGETTVARGQEIRFPSLVVLGRWVLGFLALALNEPAEAWEDLRSAAEAVQRLGRGDPGQAPVLPDAIEAAVGVDQVQEAESLLATLEAQARVREHRWAIAAVSRCRALLLLARGQSDAALMHAEDAASGFEAAGFPLDRGRAHLVAGESLRRLGERRRAAEKLEAARQIFAELGAPLWVARAEKELRRASPRPRRNRELTSAERRVAALVAAGRTNREVAAQLFTTVGTVEVHLTRIYRKLAVRSRTELALRVAEGTLDLADE
jgi:DNA-binding CsgD family transcriptional regulator